MKDIMTAEVYFHWWLFEDGNYKRYGEMTHKQSHEAISKAYALYIIDSLTDDDIDYEGYNEYNGVHGALKELKKRIK